MTRKLRQRILRALSLALVGAALAAGTAQAERPDASVAAAIGARAGVTGTAPAWLEALEARSEALNKEHGLGDYAERHALGTPGPGWKEALMTRSDAMNRRYGLGAYGRQTARSSTTPGWLAALIARSDALNEQYGLGKVRAAVIDNRGGMLGVGAASASAGAPSAVPDAFEGAVARSTGASLRPDDRGEPRGPGVYFSVPPVPSGVVSTDDFQWGDASAGAGAMLVAILLAAGLTVSIRHRGRAALP